MIAITPRQLEVLAAIAASGSVRAAADRLGLTQPAASMALAELERLLGRKLFDRRQRRLHLNAEGRALLPAAVDIVDRMRDIVRADATPSGGALAIGASNTIGNYLVGALLGGFVAAHPSVHLTLRVANTVEIVAALVDFALDVGCVEGPAGHADIIETPWREDTLVVCARSDHPLAKKRRIRASDLRDERWILREPGSATRALFEDVARDAIGPLDVALELGQSEAIKQAVIAGLGVACLPKVALADALANGSLVALDVPSLSLTRTLSLVVHRARYRGATLRAFLDIAGRSGIAARRRVSAKRA
jgi:DNA-binding transcriptional LysR family regulator